MKALASIALIIATTPLTGAAFAADRSDDLPQRVVRFRDLDLTQPAGAEALFSRLRTAAREVCEPVSSVLHLDRQCTNEALANAVADVDQPVLTQYYLVKTRHTVADFETLLQERSAARRDVRAQ